MGTNYYARDDLCPCCGRYEVVHICKSKTIFRGYTEESEGSEVVGEIRSWADWKRYLLTKRPEIVDEYGETHDLDEFVASVERVQVDDRRRSYDWSLDHGLAGAAEWLCHDGFSFTSREFS